MRKLICLLLILILIQLSCAPSVELIKFDSVSRPHKTGEIDVYTNHDSISKPYKEIGLIEVGESRLIGNKEQTMLNTLIFRAKQLGADGIIVVSRGEETEPGGFIHYPGSPLPTPYYETKRRVLIALAIVYQEKQ